ncbi:MAG: response regulator [Anaerolineae bacterium]|nr:response regulator [Anaerolineae bacterium]
MANILVAEDERDIRELIKFTLSYAGHTVTAVGDGATAVDQAQKATPDLILMDVRMPRLTGYQECEQLKQIDALKSVPIVFLSAKGQDEEIQQGINVGAAAYILKPFSPQDLIDRVSEILKYGVQ